MDLLHDLRLAQGGQLPAACDLDAGGAGLGNTRCSRRIEMHGYKAGRLGGIHAGSLSEIGGHVTMNRTKYRKCPKYAKYAK